MIGTTLEFRQTRSLLWLVLCASLLLPQVSGGQQPSLQQMKKSMELMKRFQQEVADQEFDKVTETLKELIPLGQQLFPPEQSARLRIMRGTYLRDLGRYDEARAQLRDAISYSISRLGSSHGTAGVANNVLGSVHRLQGNLDQASDLYQQSIQILDQTHDNFLADRIDAYVNYGDLLDETGQRAKGLALTRKAVTLSRERFGSDAPRTIRILNNLALRQRSVGNLADAEKSIRQAIAGNESIYGPTHEELAVPVTNLALILTERGKYQEASSNYSRALSILRTKLGDKHPSTIQALINLGQLYQETGEANKALPLLTESLNQQISFLGDQHPSVATTRHNLGTLYVDLKRYEEAKQLLNQTVDRFSRADSNRLRNVAESLAWLGMIDALQSNEIAAIRRLQKATETANRAAWVELPLLTSPEQNKFMVATYNPAFFISLSLGFSFPDNQNVVDATAEWSANGKGIGSEAMYAARHDKTNRSLPWISLQQIRDSLGQDEVWVNITRQDFIDYQGQTYKQRLKDAQYVAWMVPKNGKVSRIELGDAATIEKLVDTARRAAAKPTASEQDDADMIDEAKRALAQVAQQVWDPIRSKLPGNTDSIALCPDGALWLLPWSALPVDDDYLIQQFSLTTYCSGRDLIRGKTAQRGGRSRSAIFADPNFDQPEAEKARAIKAIFRKGTRRQVRSSLAKTVFDPQQYRAGRLPGTAREAEAVSAAINVWLGTAPTRYQGSYALETVAREMVAPRVLVFATHGFFIDDEQQQFDPLRRCGLLLAGCNTFSQTSRPNDDGVLTGVEITEMNLNGTELVVLSACETGVGRIENGNGIAGLCRAFQLAGASTVASTLWQIPDAETAELMENFFTSIADGKTKSKAMQAAQIRLIESLTEKRGVAHPFYWAAFSISGN